MRNHPVQEFTDNLKCSVWPVRSRRRRRVAPPPPPTPEELRARAAQIEEMEAAAARAEAAVRAFWINNRQSLLGLGRDMPEGSGRSTFTHVGCVAALLGIIEGEGKSREEILSAMRSYRYSYRHAGFLLTKLTGTDPKQHLWFKTDDRRYQLLDGAAQAA